MNVKCEVDCIRETRIVSPQLCPHKDIDFHFLSRKWNFYPATNRFTTFDMVSAADINKISTMKRFLFSLLSDFNATPSKKYELFKSSPINFRFFKEKKKILIQETL